MCSNVRQIFGVIETFIALFFIEQIMATNYYGIYERYPIEVAKYHVPYSRTGLKRDIRKNDFIQIVKKYNQSHDLINDEEAKTSQKNSKNVHSNKKHHRTCVKCPGEITAIVRKGLDGILVETPSPLSCKTNLPFARDLYRIETLFGTDLSFVLPEGKHSFIGKIRNIESGLIVRSCVLKYETHYGIMYHVIVRRCHGLPTLSRKNVKMSCTAANIWGSQCTFECKNDVEILSHPESIICNEELDWIGDEPDCISDIDITLPDYENEFCSQPEPPLNGRFICDAKNQNLSNKTNVIANFKNLAAGSLCRVQCNRSYSIPYHLYSLSSIQCTNGAWNSTDIEFCYKKQSLRRHLTRRHGNARSSNRKGRTHFDAAQNQFDYISLKHK